MSALFRTAFATGMVCGLTLFVPGCDGENPTMSYESYDRSCQKNADCVLVWSGDVCTCDDIGAISKSASEQYASTRTELQEQCDGVPKCSKKRWRAVCNAKTCRVDQPLPDVGGDTSEADVEPDTADTTDGPDAADATGEPDAADATDAADTGRDDTASGTDVDGGTSDTTDDSGPRDAASDSRDSGASDTSSDGD